jgi:hypothetical protein
MTPQGVEAPCVVARAIEIYPMAIKPPDVVCVTRHLMHIRGTESARERKNKLIELHLGVIKYFYYDLK